MSSSPGPKNGMTYWDDADSQERPPRHTQDRVPNDFERQDGRDPTAAQIYKKTGNIRAVAVDGGFARFRAGRSGCWARRNAIYDHFPRQAAGSVAGDHRMKCAFARRGYHRRSRANDLGLHYQGPIVKTALNRDVLHRGN
jgi:hypothetical protein